MNSKSSRIVT